MTRKKAIELLGEGRVIDIQYNNRWNNPDMGFTGSHRIVIFLVGTSTAKLRPDGTSGKAIAIRAYDYEPIRSLSNKAGWKKFLIGDITSFTETDLFVKTPPLLYNRNDKGMSSIYAAR